MEYKQKAAHAAVEQFVQSNTIVGLGTGSTAKFAIERIGEKLQSGQLENVTGVATSDESAALAKSAKIPLTDLNALGDQKIDVVIDGADEIDLNGLSVTKGGGAALYREKMVENWSKKFVVVADTSKLLSMDISLGATFKIPVEVSPAYTKHVQRKLEKLSFMKALNCTVEHRIKGRDPVITSDGNHILDLFIDHPRGFHGYDLQAVGEELIGVVGVVEHGLFVSLATDCIVCGVDGLRQWTVTAEKVVKEVTV